MRGLHDFIAVFDGAVEADMCRHLIARFEGEPGMRVHNGAGIMPGLEQSAWSELDLARLGDRRILSFFADQVRTYFARYGERCRLTLPLSPVQKLSELILKRYEAGTDQRFQPHFDALGPVSNRYLVFLWYLNDVATGGETWFPDLDLKVAPRTGRLLVFPPYWMYQHAGLPPVSSHKYILSTYCLY